MKVKKKKKKVEKNPFSLYQSELRGSFHIQLYFGFAFWWGSGVQEAGDGEVEGDADAKGRLWL